MGTGTKVPNTYLICNFNVSFFIFKILVRDDADTVHFFIISYQFLTIIIIIMQLHEVLRKAMSSANAKELVSGSKSNRLRSSSFSQDRWATFSIPVTLVSPFSVIQLKPDLKLYCTYLPVLWRLMWLKQYNLVTCSKFNKNSGIVFVLSVGTLVTLHLGNL